MSSVYCDGSLTKIMKSELAENETKE